MIICGFITLISPEAVRRACTATSWPCLSTSASTNEPKPFLTSQPSMVRMYRLCSSAVEFARFCWPKTAATLSIASQYSLSAAAASRPSSFRRSGSFASMPLPSGIFLRTIFSGRNLPLSISLAFLQLLRLRDEHHPRVRRAAFLYIGRGVDPLLLVRPRPTA
jgi:hypothetical protein